MHTCIGVDVGVVKNNDVTVFTHKNDKHSRIVRVANGYRTPQEQALVALYAPKQTLVRLYPVSFDETLAGLIATHLSAQSLKQLSGQYELRYRSLWLTDISLNNNKIAQDWKLTNGC